MLTIFRVRVCAHHPPRKARLRDTTAPVTSIIALSPMTHAEIRAYERGDLMLATPGSFAVPIAWTRDPFRAAQLRLDASRPTMHHGRS